jgi:hypothetical protein
MIALIYCYFCGKSVSTAFEPVPTDTPDGGLILRALVVCPECIESKKILIPEDNANGTPLQVVRP